jgi:hypothetical protein
MQAGKRDHRTTLLSAKTVLLGTLTLAVLLSACEDAGSSVTSSASHSMRPEFTMGSGTTSTLIGQGTHDDIKMLTRRSREWDFSLRAKDGLEVIVRSFAYAVDAQTGWHQHPGPVLIQVLEGTMTFYEADDPECRPIVVTAGHGYIDTGHGHIGRNESGAPARDLTVFFAPPGTEVAALRIDMPAPQQCNF